MEGVEHETQYDQKKLKDIATEQVEHEEVHVDNDSNTIMYTDDLNET